MGIITPPVDHVQKKLDLAESDLHTANFELGRKSDEIARLNKQTWYEKLFGIK